MSNVVEFPDPNQVMNNIRSRHDISNIIVIYEVEGEEDGVSGLHMEMSVENMKEACALMALLNHNFSHKLDERLGYYNYLEEE